MAYLTPHRRRWILLGLIFCAVLLNYVDRQIVSILKPTLKTAYHLDDRGYALLVNIFAACYAVMYPLGGWLVDRFGARVTMLYAMIAWSSACLGAGFSHTFGQFAFFRGMLGLAEPTAFPAQLRVVTVWFPATLRATANSVSVVGGTIGAIVAPPLVAWLALAFDWRSAFIVPGTVGLFLAFLWFAFYRDPPTEVVAEVAGPMKSAAVGGREVFAWPRLWRTRSLWGILLCRFISDPVWYFCLFWLPGYLQEHSGLTLAQTGKVGWIPFLVAGVGGVSSSIWSDALVKRGHPPLRARKIMLTVAAVLAPVAALTPHLPHVAVTLAVFSIVGAVCLSWLYTLSVVVAETFPAGNVGSVLGIAAGFGSVGAILFNAYVGSVMESIGSGQMFAVMAVLHPLAAIVLWTMVRPERPSRSGQPDGVVHE